MEIVGKTDDGFIIEASKEELANLTGYYWEGSDDCEVRNLKIGDRVRVSDMYNQLDDLSSKEDFLKHKAKQLREYADQLEIMNPIVEVDT